MSGRSCQLLISALLCLIAAAVPGDAWADRDGAPQNDELAHATTPAVHGMVVFGEQTSYAYHLPMWSGVHAWQIVVAVAFDPIGAALYRDERAGGSALTTFVPEPFALATLKPGVVLRGSLYHGHFEQGGWPLPRGHRAIVSAQVKQLLLIAPLDPAQPSRQAALYRLFGHQQEWYAVHIAAGAPDFDQVIGVLPTPGPVPSDPLGGGTSISLPGVGPTASVRPQVGERASGVLRDGREIGFEVRKECYFSQDDLGLTREAQP